LLLLLKLDCIFIFVLVFNLCVICVLDVDDGCDCELNVCARELRINLIGPKQE